MLLSEIRSNMRSWTHSMLS